MNPYADKLFDSDLDAYKNSGAVLTASLNFSGSIGAGGEITRTTQLTVEDVDFYELLFDSSTKHSGQFKSMRIVAYSLITETTFGSEIGVDLTTIITGNIITIKGVMFNPYSSPISLSNTTFNFRYIPYEATI